MSGPLTGRDWVLIGVLLTAWVAVFGYNLVEAKRYGMERSELVVSSAASPDAHPVLLASPQSDLRPGDVLLALDGEDLSGRSAISVLDAAEDARRAGRAAVLRIGRDAERLEVRVVSTRVVGWWAFLPFAACVLGTALLILIRAPHWHLARRYFVACWFFAVLLSLPTMGGAERSQYAIAGLILFPLGAGIGMWNAQDFLLSALPVPAWHRALIAITCALVIASMVNVLWLPTDYARTLALDTAQAVAFAGVMLGGLTRAYRHAEPLEKRQVRWVILGFYIALVASLADPLYRAYGLPFSALPRIAMAIAAMGVPVGIMISVIGYRFLDVERVISATASYSIVGGAVVVAALAAIPRVAGPASGAIGIDPGTVQTLLTVALIGAAIPVHRYLRPHLDRRMFAERHERALGFERLLEDIGLCTTVEELTRMSGERLDALLEPESIAIYATEETAFTPVFTRGRAVPPAFDVSSPLVHTLEQRMRPLAADAEELDPFDRAALETLDVSVIIPTRRTDAVVAFTCLGPKRSGDIYTPEDLAHMAAVASRCSEVLLKLSDEVVIREARELQQSMRRYVPGAIAEELASGRDLESGERELSVLFVDIRGYSGFAERREADEIFSTINRYTEEVSRVVGARGGVVVEFNGDGMMAVFGAPRPLEQKERAAVECAREITTSLPDEISVGIGIATGPAFVGNIQSADRLIWSAIGNTTNLAARLQALTRDLEASIAIDSSTRERAGYVCADFEEHSEIPIRGRSDRRQVFTLPL
jgi:class 3 adenylate cyclase